MNRDPQQNDFHDSFSSLLDRGDAPHPSSRGALRWPLDTATPDGNKLDRLQLDCRKGATEERL
jgi:hypothetical protein